MKKRIAKKIYHRVRLDFDIALFNGYTFGVNPFIEERTVVLDKPLRIYSHSQFKKACKVLNKAVPKCTFGSTPVKRRNYRVYLKEIAYYPNSNEVETITAKVDGREWLDADCYTLAKNDGLSVQDFKEWFFGKDPKEDKVFKGGIIHFTDLRY